MNEVDDAIRQTSLVHDSSKRKRKQRGVLRRLPNARVSAHDGWNHLPEWDSRWEVASVDDSTNTERSSVRKQLLVRQFRIDGLTIQSSAFGLEKEACINRFLDFSSTFFQRLTNFSSLQTDEIVLVLHQQTTHVANDLATGWCRCCRPCRERSVSRIQCGINICFCRKRKCSKNIAQVCRIL